MLSQDARREEAKIVHNRESFYEKLWVSHQNSHVKANLA